MRKVEKATEITNARIQFVSLVDRAANLKKFLLKKEDGGKASFTTYGRIVNADSKHHYVTGIVYEPMEEDSHGNFMVEEEITKAAYYFAKNGSGIDIQHNFEPFGGATVVESWIAKADFKLGSETVKRGTWLMTAEVTDADVWAAIEKGEITGFSMGGIGEYSEEDVELNDIEKQTSGNAGEKKGLFKQLAEAFGFSVVEKDVAPEPQNAAETSLPVKKAGRAMSSKNYAALSGIRDSLNTFLKDFEPEPEVEDNPGEAESASNATDPPSGGAINKQEVHVMTQAERQELEQIVASAIEKAMGGQKPAEGTQEAAGAAAGAQVEKQATPAPEGAEDAVTPESVQKMVEAAITKALAPAQTPEPAMTAEQVQEYIQKSVEAAVEPILKARGLPTNLGSAPVEKQAEEHYLHGIL